MISPVVRSCADQVALLPLGVDDVGVAGLDRRLVAVGAQGHEPVGVADAVDACRCATGRPGCCCPGCRRRRGRRARRRPPPPCRTGSPAGWPRSARCGRGRSSRRGRRRCRRAGSRGRRRRKARAWLSECLSFSVEPAEGGAAVVGDLDARRPSGRRGRRRGGWRRAPGSSGGRWRPTPRRDFFVQLSPRSAGAPDAAGAVAELDRGVQHVGSWGEMASPILPMASSGRPALQPPPGGAAVGGLVEARLGAAVDRARPPSAGAARWRLPPPRGRAGPSRGR